MDTAKKKIICAIYARVSTDEQNQGEFTSIDNQIESCKNYIKSQKHEGWILSPKIYKDAGYSGGNIKRPALQQLLSDARKSEFNTIVTYKVDRLTRSLRDFHKINEEVFEKFGIDYVSATQQFNTTSAHGRMFLYILLSFAQYEREINSERTSDKMAAAAAKGMFLGGMPRLGFDIKDKKLILNKKEVPLVKHIFEVYIENASLSKTVRILNSEGNRTKKWTTKEGKILGGNLFNRVNLSSILRDSLYIGKVQHKNNIYKGEHSAIIKEALFKRANAIIQKNDVIRKSSHKDAFGFLLGGLIRCNYCKSIMTPKPTIKKTKTYRYYQCVKVDKFDASVCKVKRAEADEIEMTVIQRLKKLSENKALLKKIIQKAEHLSQEIVEPLKKDKRRLTQQLTEVDKQAKTFVDKVFEEMKDNEFIKDKLDALSKQKSQLQDKVNSLDVEIIENENHVINAKAIEANLKMFKDSFNTLSINEQKELLHLLIKEIIYDGIKHTLSIYLWEIPEIGITKQFIKEFAENKEWLPHLDSNQEPSD